jgi:hypothetical protein
MLTPIPATARQHEVRRTEATVIDLHRWQRARDAEARQRTMLAHPAGGGGRRPRPVIVPGR